MNKEEIKLVSFELILDYIKNNDYSKHYRRINDTLAIGNEVLENIESILYITTLDNYNKLKQENKQLKELYKKTCKHLFDIGNNELARYFKAQIDENNTFMVGDK